MALSPSRSSTASWMPVEAPLGVIARNMPLCVYTSASTVGFPLLSKICLPTILVIAAGVCFRRYSACGFRDGRWTEEDASGTFSEPRLVGFLQINDVQRSTDRPPEVGRGVPCDWTRYPGLCASNTRGTGRQIRRKHGVQRDPVSCTTGT